VISVYVARKLLAALLFFSPFLCAAAQKPPGKTRHVPKTIWNFEGGVFIQTDGDLSENTCFRLAGRVTARDFFDNLKRVDDDRGTAFVRGKEAITEFPAQLKLLFVIRDFPCPSQMHDAGDRAYLTREMMGKLHLSLFWKHGVELRPAVDFKIAHFSISRIPPYARDLADELPERLQWAYELDIPSAGIPLTDGLVLVVRREDGRIAARVAARL
jgi:hypothetical protein